jgi:hypothetical protein
LTNLASDTKHAKIVAEMRQLLQKMKSGAKP